MSRSVICFVAGMLCAALIVGSALGAHLMGGPAEAQEQAGWKMTEFTSCQANLSCTGSDWVESDVEFPDARTLTEFLAAIPASCNVQLVGGADEDHVLLLHNC